MNTIDPTKPWFASKGIWGGILVVILAALQAAAEHFDFDAGHYITILTAMAGALGIYGRKVAKSQIGE